MVTITMTPIPQNAKYSLFSIRAPVGALDWRQLRGALDAMADYLWMQATGDNLHVNGYLAIVRDMLPDGAKEKYDIAMLIESTAVAFVANRCREMLTYMLSCETITTITHLGYEAGPGTEAAEQLESLSSREVYSVAISINGELGYLHQAGELLRAQLQI